MLFMEMQCFNSCDSGKVLKYVEKQISTKISILSLWATIAVVIIHSNSLEGINGNPCAWWVGNVIAVLQGWAVPWFFIVSGFFFDRGYVTHEVRTSVFMRKKFTSLVVPYLLWGAIFGGAVLTPILMYVNLKSGRPVSENTFLDAPSFFLVIDRLIGGLRGAPPNGALWYVRMLLIIFCFAPLLKWIRVRFASGLLCAAMLVIAISSPINSGNEGEFFVLNGVQIGLKLSGAGYFMIGMVVSALSLENRVPKKLISIICMMVWCTGMFGVLDFRYNDIRLPYLMDLFLKFSPLLAIVFLWSLAWGQTPFVKRVASLKFWIYCMHHPITAYVSAGLHAILGYSIYAESLRMVLGAPICLVIVVVSGMIVRDKFGKAFAILTGGR